MSWAPSFSVAWRLASILRRLSTEGRDIAVVRSGDAPGHFRIVIQNLKHTLSHILQVFPDVV